MKELLYEESKAVSALNHVEDFEPKKLARILKKEGQPDQLYLDVKYRKLWFRLVYPTGKITSIVRSFSENAALVEARIYLDKTDAEEHYITNAFSQKFRTEDPEFGAKFLELAETAAVGRALADAGFGLQFADVGEENDPEQVDAGIQTMQPQMENVEVPYEGDPAMERTYAEGYQRITENQQSVSMGQNTMMGQFFQEARNQGTVIGKPAGMITNTMYGQQPEGSNISGQESFGKIDPVRPVEELRQMMSYEQALAVVIPGKGKYGGKTIGQVAAESPQSLEWFAQSYSGNNNAVPAAAKILLSRAFPVAG